MALDASQMENITEYLISFLVRNDAYEKHVKYVSGEEAVRESAGSRGNVYIVASVFSKTVTERGINFS